jgi:hypothetical protein
MEKNDFIGRKYSEDEISEAKQSFDEVEKELEARISKIEKRKSKEEIEIIKKAFENVNDFLKKYNIDYVLDISLDKVHFLKGDDLVNLFGPVEFTGGLFDAETNSIFINSDFVKTPENKLNCITHELIHYIQSKKYFMFPDDDTIYPSQVGYQLNSPWKERGFNLIGFNELITVISTVISTYKKIDNETLQKLSIQEKVYIMWITTIAKISGEETSVDVKNLVEKLIKGQFEENLFSIKSLLKVYGEDLFKILDLFYKTTIGGLEINSEKLKEISIYLGEKDGDKRKLIAEKILLDLNKTK